AGWAGGGDGIGGAAVGDSPGQRGSGAWAHAGDQRDGTVLFHRFLLSVRRHRQLRSRSSRNSSRSLPKKTSSPTMKVGDPKTPRSPASLVFSSSRSAYSAASAVASSALPSSPAASSRLANTARSLTSSPPLQKPSQR